MANINKKAEDYMSSARISHDVLRDKRSEFLGGRKRWTELYEFGPANDRHHGLAEVS